MKSDTSNNATALKFESDGTYLTWVNAHPDFFVLTSNKSLTPRHTVIHRAKCSKIRVLTGNAKPGGFTRNYIKVGAEFSFTLKEWALSKRPDTKVRECIACAAK